MPEPYFSSFEEFFDRTKGKGWDEIESKFRHEYEAMGFLEELSPRQRMRHQLVGYEDDLSVFYHYFFGVALPSLFDSPRRARLRKMLEQIRAEKEGMPPPECAGQ